MLRKVVVAEDDPHFCYAIEKVLTRAGFVVETHLRSIEAWPSVGATAQFDLLLTDILFPKDQPTGIALGRSAHFHHPQVPIIYMTACTSAAELVEAEGETVFAKPIDLGVLLAKVQELLPQEIE
jgi:two-component system OmpR family response regulator